MDIRYFYVPKQDIRGNKVYILGQEYLHLSKVIRKTKGDIVRVVNGEGDEYTVVLTKTGDGFAEGEIVEKRRKPNEVPFDLALACGVLKGERMEMLIEKGTELGVNTFFPLLTQRTIPDPGPTKLSRWRKIAISSMKQSRRSILPKIENPMNLREFCDKIRDYDVKILLNEKSKERPFIKNKNIRKAVIVAGPEGSFTNDEIQFLKREEFIEWNLGVRTLRTETALLFAGAIFLYLNQEV